MLINGLISRWMVPISGSCVKTAAGDTYPTGLGACGGATCLRWWGGFCYCTEGLVIVTSALCTLTVLLFLCLCRCLFLS